ncbi:MAG TPA: hypothetical protein VES19_09955, partial [Candidatus Limnocylindrales bacterium]|nr:hypothetical protein [Candidatus Limnocylindrales bacterium]
PPAPAPAWGAPPAGTPGTWGMPPAGAPPAGAPPGWGGATVPPQPPRRRGTSGRTSLAVIAIIIGVVFGANIVNAALPLPEEPTAVDPGPALPQEPGPTETQAPQPTQAPGGPAETSIPVETLPPLETAPPVDPGPVDPGTGVDVGAGFVIYPPDGWSAVGGENGLTVFQKSGTLMIVGGLPWAGTPSELATQYRDAWFAGGQFNGDEPKPGSIGNGIPAAGLNYSGVIEGTQVDGAIITGVTNGAGILFNVFGASGSLSGVSDDLDLILQTVQYTGG